MRNFKYYILAVAMIMAGKAFAGDSLLQVKRAFYSVPVAPELARLATFELKNVGFAEIENSLSFFYNLPPELVGFDAEGINLDQQSASDVSDLRKMVGRQQISDQLVNVAEATCGKHPLQEKKVQCMIVYDNLPIDREKVAAFITQTYASSPDLGQRLQIAAFFSNEPSGVLVLELE